MSTLDLTKPCEAYRMLFGTDMDDSQKQHVITLCAIYQIRPDNVEILHNVINSGYLRQSKEIFAEINEVANKIDSMMQENDTRNNGFAEDVVMKQTDFLTQFSDTGKDAAHGFWEKMVNSLGEFEGKAKIRLEDIINKRIFEATKQLEKVAFDASKNRTKNILITACSTAIVVALLAMGIVRLLAH